MKAKKILLVLIALLFLASIPLAIYLVGQRQEIRMRAAPASALSLVPSSLTVSVGESFTLDAVLETAANIVPAVEIHIIFNPAVFEATSLAAGPDMSSIFDGPTIDPGSGTAFIVVGDVENPVEGSATVASVNFNVLSESSQIEEISFAAQTQAGAWHEEGIDVLVSMNPSLVTVLASGERDDPTATPIPTATPTSTVSSATATPSPTPTSAEATATPPVTGITIPTLAFMGLGLVFLFAGAFAFL